MLRNSAPLGHREATPVERNSHSRLKFRVEVQPKAANGFASELRHRYFDQLPARLIGCFHIGFAAGAPWLSHALSRALGHSTVKPIRGCEYFPGSIGYECVSYARLSAARRAAVIVHNNPGSATNRIEECTDG